MDNLCQFCLEIYTPNDFSDKIFFSIHTNMSISSYWLVYKDSKWSGKVPGGFSYILGPILPNLIFRPYLGGGQNSRFRGKPDRGVKIWQLDTMMTGKLLLVSG